MDTTTNLGLKKPELSERYSLAVWNDNSDTLDAYAGAVNTALAGKATPGDITAAITDLDVSSEGGTGKYISAIKQVDGKIDATATSLASAPESGGTAAISSGAVYTAIQSAIAEAIAGWYKIGTKIPQGADINTDTYTALGSFYVASNTDAGYISNLPVANGGRLDVIATISDDSYVKQIYFANNDYASIYARRKLSNGWSSWEQYATYSQVRNQAFGMGTSITASQDSPLNLNSVQDIGRYYIGATASKYITGFPFSVGTGGIGCELIVERIQIDKRIRQTIIQNNGASNAGKYWVRFAHAGDAPNQTWSNWFLFEGTEVTP